MVDLRSLPTHACLSCRTPIRPRRRSPIRGAIYGVFAFLAWPGALLAHHWLPLVIAILATWCSIRAYSRICGYCQSPKYVQIDTPPGRVIMQAQRAK